MGQSLHLFLARNYLLPRYILGVLTHTTAWDRHWGRDKTLGFWNSDHVVLKLIIRTSASPWQQRSEWGLRVTQNAYFSLMTHTRQLLLVTFCDTTAGIGAILWTYAQMDGPPGVLWVNPLFIIRSGSNLHHLCIFGYL